MKTFEKIATLLEPHHLYAQIILETETGDRGLKQAYRILNTLGLTPINTEIIRKKSPILALIFLPSSDMRDAALKLSEAGFTKVLGINSSSSDITLDG